MANFNDLSQSERSELFGLLVDVVENFLEEKGITPEDIPNDERTGAEGEAIIYGSDYDRLADGFSLVLGISRDVDTPVIENTDNENDMSI